MTDETKLGLPEGRESEINGKARAYMAEWMDMHEPYEDQEQNFILSHLATFGHDLQAEVDTLRQQVETLTKEQSQSWTCFHCGETFTTPGSARDHFGAWEGAEPGCLIDRVALEEGGTPERWRGLLMALRKAEDRIAKLHRENEELENDSRLWHESEADRVRRIGNVQWWQEIDYREGEKIALTERAEAAEAQVEADRVVRHRQMNEILALKDEVETLRQERARLQEFPCGHIMRKVQRGDGTFTDFARCGICWLYEQGHETRQAERGKYEAQLAALTEAQARVTWQPIETAPKDEDVDFWIVPLTPEESFVDSSGNSIFSAGPPRRHTGRLRSWGSLYKATHWMPLPQPPAPPASAPPETTEDDLTRRDRMAEQPPRSAASTDTKGSER